MSQERGKGWIPSILCSERNAARAGLWRWGCVANKADPPNPATEKARCHTPCLPKVPKGRARRSRATTGERIPRQQRGRRRPSPGTSQPTGKTGDTREENSMGSQRIHSTCSLPHFWFIFFQGGGKGSLFCKGKLRSRFDSTQPNDTSKTTGWKWSENLTSRIKIQEGRRTVVHPLRQGSSFPTGPSEQLQVRRPNNNRRGTTTAEHNQMYSVFRASV